MKNIKTLIVTFVILSGAGLAIADEMGTGDSANIAVIQPFDQNGNPVQLTDATQNVSQSNDVQLASSSPAYIDNVHADGLVYSGDNQ